MITDRTVKKTFAAIAAAAMMLSSLPVLAFAADDDEPAVAERVMCTDETHTEIRAEAVSGYANKHAVYCTECDKIKETEHEREASDETPVSSGDKGHTVKCKHCTITWTEAHDTDGEDGACSVCGYVAEPEPVPARDVCEDENHTETVMVIASGNASRHELHCADCDKLKGDGSKDHNREASDEKPVSKGDKGHTVKCKHCTITWTETHDTDGEDGECSVCGYAAEPEPVPVPARDVCEDENHTETVMVIASGNASRHELHCADCDKLKGDGIKDHNREASDEKPVSKGDKGHTVKCKHCTITWTEAHDTDGEDGACSVCGYVAEPEPVPVPARDVCEDENHTETVMVIASGNASRHELHCADCDKLKGDGSEDHNREASDEKPVSKGDKGHTVKCKHCTITWTEAHDTNGADGACSACGYKPEPDEPEPAEPAVPIDCDHQKTHTIVATGYAVHEEYCDKCNAKISEHNREANGDVPVSNGKSGHTVKCRYCSITWSEAHTYRDNGTCFFCGEMHEHIYRDVWEPFTDLHHAKRCTIVGCKYIIANYHVDSNKDGVCDVCGSADMKNQTGGSSSANTPTIITDPTVTAAPAIITAATAASKFASTPKEIRNSNKSDITVNAAETKVTSDMMTAFTKNKKAKTLTLDYGTKLKIVINKSDVKKASKTDPDFSISGKNFISSKTINKYKNLSKAEKIVQLKFVNDGKLKGIDKVTVKTRVGKNYAGHKAVVYEYADGKLVKISTVKVNGSGYVSFKTDHLGKFVIAVE